MKRKWRIILLSALIFLLAGLAWLVLSNREPVYQGKPLSVWLEQERSNDAIDPEAEAAIRAMGADAIPALLRMVGTRDTGVRSAVLDLSKKFDWFPFHTRPAKEFREKAVCGFIALGSLGKPAVPGLIAYLHDPDPEIRFCAAFCLAKIGPEARAAVAPLVDYLSAKITANTGAFWIAELELASYALAEIGPDARLAVPQLTRLAAITSNVGMANLEAQAALIKIRGDSLDPLIDRLKDTSNPTNWIKSGWVVYFLRTKAEPAIPALISSLQQTNQLIQDAALRTLYQIRARPDLCIPAIIPFLQSTNPWFRRGAIEGIRGFGSTSNHLGVAEVTKLLGDPDPEVSRKAARALKQIDPAAAAKAGVK